MPKQLFRFLPLLIFLSFSLSAKDLLKGCGHTDWPSFMYIKDNKNLGVGTTVLNIILKESGVEFQPIEHGN